jgi:N-acetylglutamate synthase-like GNAT family acetyltransferase
MFNENELVIRMLNKEDLYPELLKYFNRYQKVVWVWRNVNGEKVLKEEPFIDDWNDERKKEVVSQDFKKCIEAGGVVLGGFIDDKLIAFATLKNDFFGSSNQYVLLSQLHVSYEYRHFGIGKCLFKKCVTIAKEWGVKKIYISAHSAEETQRFYNKVGCVEAKEINRKLVEQEPFDCQLEYVVYIQ